jgi:hypothetical protein
MEGGDDSDWFPLQLKVLISYEDRHMTVGTNIHIDRMARQV